MLTYQERNTVLAALRFYVDNGQGEPDNRSDAIHDLATGEGTARVSVSLDAEAIERLIAKLA